jgi:hypothetical protein
VVSALRYAELLSKSYRAVYVAVEPDRSQQMQVDWARLFPHVPLVVLDSPYRSLVQPLLDYIDLTRERNPGDTVTVVLPEYFTRHWWDIFLLNTSGPLIKMALAGREDVVLVNVRFRVEG